MSHGIPTFDLINLKKLYNEALIKSSNSHLFGQQAAVFKNDSEKGEYPMSMHFASKELSEDGKTTIRWHRLQFKKDFKEILPDFLRIPTSMDIIL